MRLIDVMAAQSPGAVNDRLQTAAKTHNSGRAL
jgi:hypothetical protein